MPELPDVTVYVESLMRCCGGQRLEAISLGSPFVLRTVEPAPDDLVGRALVTCRRLGKRIALGFEGDLFLVVHLMIAGRLRWRTNGKRPPGKAPLARLDFESGVLWLTEASSKKRASLHVVPSEALAELDRGGLEVLDADLSTFVEALQRESRTLKRALTDPRIFSGIGNAYSDEILFHAGLSPVRLTTKLDDAELQRLYDAVRSTLADWTERLRDDVGDAFPEKVTAFRPDMAVHGRYGEPCRTCDSKIQRIRYASNESNYCPVCQNAGRLLADRGLSQLMRKDWPKTLEELEELRRS